MCGEHQSKMKHLSQYAWHIIVNQGKTSLSIPSLPMSQIFYMEKKDGINVKLETCESDKLVLFS